MTKEQLKEIFGFDTWFELYKFLRSTGNINKQVIKVAYNKPVMSLLSGINACLDVVPHPEITVNVADIKCLAIDELFSQLPTQPTIQVLHQVVEELRSVYNSQESIKNLHSFLDNLPNR